MSEVTSRLPMRVLLIALLMAFGIWLPLMAVPPIEDVIAGQLGISNTLSALLYSAPNNTFICIKVDREERPDIDAVYMKATLAMTGSGGWPTSIFLSPALEPFYAGTYFPPTRRYNLPSFMEVLQAVASAWENDSGKVIASGQKILEHLRVQSAVSQYEVPFEEDLIHTATQNLLAADYPGYNREDTGPVLERKCRFREGAR